MSYIFKGNLRGFYCGECYDFISNANIKIYAVEKNADVTAMAVAREKETFHQRSEEELKALPKRLIGEGLTDEEGNFSIRLDEKNYGGGAFDIDFECGTVPIKLRLKNPPKPIGPLQFHITTFQPIWKESGNGQASTNEVYRVAYWEHSITARFWCWLLRLFRLYVVCGRVEVCEKKTPLGNVRVKAYDVDLIQDDYLGDGITNAAGYFKIYFTEADFSKTIFSWLNVEWPAGPDLYFGVETLGGAILMKEPRSKGHTPGRENAGHCTCVNLCVDPGQGPEPGPEPIPAFLRIGGIDYDTDMQSHVGESGLTNSQYAFFSTLRLNGVLSQTLNGQPMEYCFEFTGQYDGAGNPVNWQRVLAGHMGQRKIGHIEKAALMPADATHPFPWYKYTNTDCIVSSLPVPAGKLQVPIAADGWILVPQQHDNPLNGAGVGMFVSNGDQVSLDSTKLDAFPPIDLTGLVAGNSSTSTGKPLANDKVFAVRMLVREQGNNASIAEAGRCTRMAVDNTLYKGMSHHPEWGPWGGGNEYGVCMVDILQLQAAGCSKITTQVDVLYTCAHPNLGSVAATLTGPTGSINLPVAPLTTDMHGSIIHSFSSSDPLCAYLVTLSATYLLTTGDGSLDPVSDQIAFCR